MQELRVFRVFGDKDEKIVCESNWNGTWKNPGRLFYPRGETLSLVWTVASGTE